MFDNFSYLRTIMTTTAETGRRGEVAAREYLRGAGYLIRELNWRCGRYEIDIVAQRFDTIRFVEVKTRRALGATLPEQALDRRKLSALQRAAELYMSQFRIDLDPHFDFIAVDVLPDDTLQVRYFPDGIII